MNVSLASNCNNIFIQCIYVYIFTVQLDQDKFDLLHILYIHQQVQQIYYLNTMQYYQLNIQLFLTSPADAVILITPSLPPGQVGEIVTTVSLKLELDQLNRILHSWNITSEAIPASLTLT